jgi:hypothetical protein
MASELLSPRRSNEHADVEAVNRMQEEAAAHAGTVGGFRSTFRRLVDQALQDGSIQHASVVRERSAAVDEVTNGQSDLRMEATEAGVLGWNSISAGRSGMRLSKQMYASIRSNADQKNIKQVVAHEAAHGNQVALRGELRLGDRVVDHIELYEGHAEINGNEDVGMSMTQHREGQPKEVYAEGQNIAVDIIKRTSRANFERALTEDGDLDALQRKIDRSYALAA